MACGGDCDCGPCSKARGVLVSGWASRRKRALSVQKPSAARARASSSASSWARSRGALVGGAAARDSVPVSTGGHYRPARRGARVGQADPGTVSGRELVQQIDHALSIILEAIDTSEALAAELGEPWIESLSTMLAAWTSEREELAAAPSARLDEWARIIEGAIEAVRQADARTEAPVTPAVPPAMRAGLRPLGDVLARARQRPAAPPPAPPLGSSTYRGGPVRVAPAAAPTGRRAGVAVLDRPKPQRGTVTVPSWLSWVPRIGQATDEVYLARARQLDADFNALADAAFSGGARGTMLELVPSVASLGEAWARALRGTIERWRTDRDELRETALVFGTVWGPRLDGYAADVERFARDLRRVEPTAQIPSEPRQPAPGPVEGAARALGRGLSAGLRTGAEGLALAGAFAIFLWAASQAAARAA